MATFDDTLDTIMEEAPEKIPDTVINQIQKQLTLNNPSLTKMMEENNLESAADLAAWLYNFTPSGRVIPWVIKLVAKGRLNLPEDGERLYAAIENYKQTIKHPKYDGPKDINQIKGLHELEDENNKVIDAETKRKQLAKAKEALENLRDKSGISVIYQDQKFKVVMFDSKNQEIKSKAKRRGGESIATTEVAEKLAQACSGTSWCTQNSGTAQSFLNSGPMYFVYKEINGDWQPFLLADYKWHQVMNTSDNSIEAPGQVTDFFLGRFVHAFPMSPEMGKNIETIRSHMYTDLIYNGRPEFKYLDKDAAKTRERWKF